MRNIKKIALLSVGDSAWQGGIQYILNIIYALDTIELPQPLQVDLFKHEHQVFPEFEGLKNVQVQEIITNKVLPPFSFYNRVIWFLQRKLFGRINPRLENYCLKQEYDYVYPAVLSACGKKLNAGSWIADFQYHYFPEGHNKETISEAEQTIKNIANQTGKIIFSSNYCLEDAHKLYPVTKGKSFVMPFAVHIKESYLNKSLLDSVKEKYCIKQPYIMVANLFAPTKNHETLFKAVGILKKQGINLKVICTGNLVLYSKMEYTNEVLQMLTDNTIHEQVYFLGLIPRDHQIALYRGAMAVVQPSLSEGWSTCVEEAKALGKILILSDIPVHKEQYPENPYFFKSLDPDDLAVKLKNVYNNFFNNFFPDTELEQQALEKYRQKQKEFGANFIKIAQA